MIIFTCELVIVWHVQLCVRLLSWCATKVHSSQKQAEASMQMQLCSAQTSQPRLQCTTVAYNSLIWHHTNPLWLHPEQQTRVRSSFMQQPKSCKQAPHHHFVQHYIKHLVRTAARSKHSHPPCKVCKGYLPRPTRPQTI